MDSVEYKDYFEHKELPLGQAVKPGETLQRGTRILERLGLNYWICAGTALGLHRNKDFIPNDTDIDVGVEYSWHHPFLHVVAENIIYAMRGMRLLRTQHYQGRPMQIAFLDENNVVFDIYFYYTDFDPDRVVNYNTNGKMVMPYYLFMEKEFSNTIYGKFPFPKPIEDFLIIRYGQDWQTPKEDKGIFTA